MSFLLDTNVVSEWTRPKPDPRVVAFLETTDEDTLFLSVVTLAELRRGVDRLHAGRRRDGLRAWLDNDLVDRFDSRILGIDRGVAAAWGRIMAQAERRGRAPGVMDAWIAATAEVHSLTIATRNTVDFAPLFRNVFNPWAPAPWRDGGQGAKPRRSAESQGRLSAREIPLILEPSRTSPLNPGRSNGAIRLRGRQRSSGSEWRTAPETMK